MKTETLIMIGAVVLALTLWRRAPAAQSRRPIPGATWQPGSMFQGLEDDWWI